MPETNIHNRISDFIYWGLISIPALFTLAGIVYMCWMHCKLKRKCLSLCTSLEKEDTNLDYGTYYYADGDRRTDVMEVVSKIIKSTAANDFIIFVQLLGEP